MLGGGQEGANRKAEYELITQVEFSRYRGFERLRADLSPHAYIVGPNSAGKSTVLEAIALAERSLQLARRKTPPLRVTHRGGQWKGYRLDRSSDDGEDPVRFDFGQDEAHVAIHWSDDAVVHLVWPRSMHEDDDGIDEGGFFYLEIGDGGQPRSVDATRTYFPSVVVVPVVTPLDRVEELKDARYVRSQSATRRASRHFRNHAFLLDQAGEWATFKDFCAEWLPELDLLDVVFHAGANQLSVYYSEPGSRVPKELAWAGDGFQIWVQLLWHLYKARDAATVLLDEPEVYLHPDLQRRLVRLLDSLGCQVILASHSADVIAEAPDGGVLWVDRRAHSARRASSRRTFSALSTSLGSSFDLALAKSGRSRLVLACDAEDARFIRALARQIGALSLADEQAVNIVPIREPSNSAGWVDLARVLHDSLPANATAVVLLGSGLRHPRLNHALLQTFANVGIEPKVCDLPELENYLLDPGTIARVSGAADFAVAQRIAEAHEALWDAARSAFTARWVSLVNADARAVLEEAEDTFDRHWADVEHRSRVVRATWVLGELNKWLELEGYRTVTALSIARAIRAPEIPTELLTVLLDLDDRAAPVP